MTAVLAASGLFDADRGKASGKDNCVLETFAHFTNFFYLASNPIPTSTDIDEMEAELELLNPPFKRFAALVGADSKVGSHMSHSTIRRQTLFYHRFSSTTA